MQAMTAPGDSLLLIALLAAFMACLGYSIGRLHQRYQSAPDREEAYRNGYDAAARNVFSMAARVAGPRRERGAVHASAAIPPSGEQPGTLAADGPAPEPVATPAEPTVPLDPASPAGRDPEEPTAPLRPGREQLGFPAPRPHNGPGAPQPAAVGGVAYTSLSGPRWPATPDLGPDGVPRPGPPAVPGQHVISEATRNLGAGPRRAPEAGPRHAPEAGNPPRQGSGAATAPDTGLPVDDAATTGGPVVAPSAAGPAGTDPVPAARPAGRGRHMAPDEPTTTPLTPDRMARIRAAGDRQDPPVPRPRRS